MVLSWPSMKVSHAGDVIVHTFSQSTEEVTVAQINFEELSMLYLDLMKKCLTRLSFPEKNRPFDQTARTEGRDWPAEAETMIGLTRLENLQYCLTEAIRKGVPGDCIETGVWRGGASIFMRAVLKAYGDQSRTVWVADSFRGLPKPDGRYHQDQGDRYWELSHFLGVPLEQVQANFARYGLLDEQVRFLVGWFKDTLPTAPISRLAVLRLDGDMYSSTMDALKSLYDKVSPGGYVIIDDYGAVPNCKCAVDDFRSECQITEQLQQIDWTGVFWEKIR
jgi:O-methyltransferase